MQRRHEGCHSAPTYRQYTWHFPGHAFEHCRDEARVQQRLWFDLNFYKWWSFKKVELAWTIEITNILNNQNPAIINPVTGRAYQYGDPVPTEWRDPIFNDPRDPRSDNQPPDNPARYMAQRHIMTGISIKFK